MHVYLWEMHTKVHCVLVHCYLLYYLIWGPCLEGYHIKGALQ